MDERVKELERKLTEFIQSQNFSFAEEVEIAAALREARLRDFATNLDYALSNIEELKAQEIYKEMEDASALMRKYFSKDKETKLEDIEKCINEIPKRELVHYNVDDNLKTYNDYCENLYKLVLYSSMSGRTVLLQNPEVKRIVSEKVREDVKKYKETPSIPSKLFKLVNKLEETDSNDRYLELRLLQEICAHKADISIGGITILLNEKENQREQLRIEYKKNKKAYATKTIKKVVLTTTATIANVVALGIIFGTPIGTFVFNMYDLSRKDVKILGEKAAVYSNDMMKFDPNIDFDYKITKKLLNKSKRYVTVFGDTQGELVDVKVYDYTDVDISDEELKTIELDSSKIVLSKSFRIEYFSNGNDYGKRDIYGIYTGVGHRDISHVDYKKGPIFDVLMITIGYLILLEFFAFVIALAISEEISDPLFVELKKVHYELEETGRIKRETLEKLEEITKEIKNFYYKQDKNKSSYKMIVDEELEKLRTTKM